MSDDDSLNKLLDGWKDDFRPDSSLASRVRAEADRVGNQERHRPSSVAVWMANVFARPGLVAGFAVVFVLVGMGVSQLVNNVWGGNRDEMTLSYRLSIDPLYRLQAMAGADEFANRRIVPIAQSTNEAPVLLAGLGWLQGQLDLSKAQYAQVSALHSDYEVAFDELFSQLVESHQAYREFDKGRMDNDVIDYFKLYELLQAQKHLSEESTRLTAELLSKVEQIIEPQQRARYRELLDTIYPDFSKKGPVTTDV